MNGGQEEMNQDLKSVSANDNKKENSSVKANGAVGSKTAKKAPAFSAALKNKKGVSKLTTGKKNQVE